MEYGLDVLKGFDSYCSRKREQIRRIRNREQRACQEKALIARSLLYRETAGMVEAYARYVAIVNNRSEVREFMEKIREIEGREIRKEFIRECEISLNLSGSHSARLVKLQETLLGMICAGLEDTSFNKWKVNLADAVEEVRATQQAARMSRFLSACADVADSLDIDLSDVEEEFRAVFEPECVYNTLVLAVTAVKCYCEALENAYERIRKDMKNRYRHSIGRRQKAVKGKLKGI